MTLDAQTRRKLEELYAEAKWRQWSHDPAAFIEECLWLAAPSSPKGRVPFGLFDYQREDLRTFQQKQRVVVLKARQLGETSLAMAWAFWHLMFRPSANIVLVSKDRDTSNEALERNIDFFYRWMPKWTHDRRPNVEIDAAKEHTYLFPDGMRSRIVSLAPTPTAGAGEPASMVLWDEAALPDVAKPGVGHMIFKSLDSTTDTTGGQMIVFSTARGGHNRFAQMYRRAQRGESEFTPIFHPWWVSPFLNPKADRLADCDTSPCPECVDETIRESKKREHLEQPWLFYAEYPNSEEEAFRQSGRTRFGGLPPLEAFDDLEWRGRITRSPSGSVELVADYDGPLRVDADVVRAGGAPQWALSALSMDPASGGGGDFTAMIGGWMTREGVPKIAAYWHANDIEPDEAARQADLLGRWLAGRQQRAALLTVEDQGGYGQTPLYVLGDLNYPNLYVHRYTGHRRHKRETRFGLPMGQGRRALVVDTLARYLRFDLPDMPLVDGIFPALRDELGAFVVGDDGVPRADTGMNDDLVMALAIWVYTLVEGLGAPAATPAPKDDGDQVQRFTLDDLYSQVEKSRSAKAREDRTFARAIATGHRRRSG